MDTKTVTYRNYVGSNPNARINRITLPAAPWEIQTGAKQGRGISGRSANPLKLLAHPARFERATSAFGGLDNSANSLENIDISNTESARIRPNPPAIRGENGAKPCVILGVKYPSQVAAALALDVDEAVIRTAISRNLTNDPALGRTWQNGRRKRPVG
jgi:hypothetical protein